MHPRFLSLTFVLCSNADSTTKDTKMGSHMAVSTGSSKASLSEERRVLRSGRNTAFTKDSRRLGCPCWSSKGNQTNTCRLSFCSLFLFPSTRWFIHLFHPSRYLGYLFHLFLLSCRHASQHIRSLLESISQFLRVNPSGSDPASEEIDIPKLLRQIRSCYKVLCSSLGVRLRLQSAEVAAMEDKEDEMDEDDVPTRTTAGSSIPVWKIDKNGMKQPVTNFSDTMHLRI
jgi:hypothetical protein